MRKIKLSQGKYAIVDDEDFKQLNKHKWHYALYKKGKGYAKSNNHKGFPKLIRMHRIIMNAKKGQEVDHINGNTIDNRKSNLRIVTRSQNMMNTGLRNTNTSGYKGICFDKRYKRWCSYTWKNGKQIYLGSSKSKKQAAIIYNIGVEKYHGSYALLNRI